MSLATVNEKEATAWSHPETRGGSRSVVSEEQKEVIWTKVLTESESSSLSPAETLERFEADIYSAYPTPENISKKLPLGLPFWDKIAPCKRILLSGCGGGYDCYHTLPLYFALEAMGKQVYIASLTFVDDIESEGLLKWRMPTTTTAVDDDGSDEKKSLESGTDADSDSEQYNDGPIVVCEVTPQSYYVIKKQSYFPELFLVRWFKSRFNKSITVFTFPRQGTKRLTHGYQMIVDKFNIDCIVTVDGGTDSLMKGTEKGVGSIEEDFSTLLAIQSVKLHPLSSVAPPPATTTTTADPTANTNENKYLVCVGLGVDRFHGVSDVSSLRAISEISKKGGFYGSLSLLDSQNEVKLYRDCCEYAFEHMEKSIVGTSILDAISGEFGNFHSNPRTGQTSKLFINPLMSMFWFLDINTVVGRMHSDYKKAMAEDETAEDMFTSVRATYEALNGKGEVAKEHENYPATDDLRRTTQS